MVITIASIKGGVGKSTFAILLANNLASRGHKVLVIDTDLNNTTSIYYTLGIGKISEICEHQNIMLALTQNKLKEHIIKSRIPNVDIIPSTVELISIKGIEIKKLYKLLSGFEEYDYTIIDTSPTYDNLVLNAIACADLIFSPCTMTEYNFNMSYFLFTKIQEDMPEKAPVCFFVINRWKESQARYLSTVQSQNLQIYQHYLKNIIDVTIPESMSVDKYTNRDEKLSARTYAGDREDTRTRLARAINKIVDQIPGTNPAVEVF
ncbi:MAG: ParA family protein [Treponema sp.]|nr:ParA family protein [Treponema sp.]